MPPHCLKIDCEKPDPASVLVIAEAIKKGQVLVYPTDTIYGLGCDAFNEDAVRRVNQLKSRAEGRPLLVLIPGREWLFRLATGFSAGSLKLVESFWPGPLTLIFRAPSGAPQGVLGDGDSIGIRWPRNPFIQALLDVVGGPIISTSANISGGQPLRDPGQEKNEIMDAVDLIVNGGPLAGRESTLLDISGAVPQLLREGAIPRNELQAILGRLQ
jgi:L-threonylcarbamoyladenylate synthase